MSKIPLLDERSGHDIAANRIGAAIRLESPRQDDVMRLLARSTPISSLSIPGKQPHLDIDTLCAPTSALRRRREARPSAAARCASIRPLREVKRMFVHPEARGQKLGRAILMRIEESHTRGPQWMRLETASIRRSAPLYRGAGYAERGPFGEYTSDPLSHFLEKYYRIAACPRSVRAST